MLWKSESNRQTFLLLASKAFLCRLACFLRGLRLSRNSQSEALIRRKGIVCPKKCPAFSGIVKHQQILDLVHFELNLGLLCFALASLFYLQKRCLQLLFAFIGKSFFCTFLIAESEVIFMVHSLLERLLREKKMIN